MVCNIEFNHELEFLMVIFFSLYFLKFDSLKFLNKLKNIHVVIEDREFLQCRYVYTKIFLTLCMAQVPAIMPYLYKGMEIIYFVLFHTVCITLKTKIVKYD